MNIDSKEGVGTTVNIWLASGHKIVETITTCEDIPASENGTILIVEDEKPARDLLKAYLEDYPELELAGEVGREVLLRDRLVAEEAIQMHGGIGVTDEHDIGFYMKRAHAAYMTFGKPSQHRQRWAELHGY